MKKNIVRSPTSQSIKILGWMRLAPMKSWQSPAAEEFVATCPCCWRTDQRRSNKPQMVAQEIFRLSNCSPCCILNFKNRDVIVTTRKNKWSKFFVLRNASKIWIRAWTASTVGSDENWKRSCRACNSSGRMRIKYMLLLRCFWCIGLTWSSSGLISSGSLLFCREVTVIVEEESNIIPHISMKASQRMAVDEEQPVDESCVMSELPRKFVGSLIVVVAIS